MPSSQPIPSVADHLKAARRALTGRRDRYGDVHAGSFYEHVFGPTAILFHREAVRDRDLFADTYFASAKGEALSTRIATMWGIPRILDTYGAGTCRFQRANTTAGAGMMLAGSRIQVSGNPPAIYQIASDTAASAAVASLVVPVQAAVLGTGTAISTTSGLTLLDSLYDPLWQPVSLSCADGTNFEQADAYRARAQALRIASRSGYIASLVSACQAAGATYVVAFPSNYGLAVDDFTDDLGLNALYVGDANFGSTSALVSACSVAVESWRVAGADLYVGGMQVQPLSIQVVVALTDDPGKCNVPNLIRSISSYLIAEFSPMDSGYSYSLERLASVIVSADSQVQQVASWSSPTSDSPSLAPTAWPVTLTKYMLAAQNITLYFEGPQ